MSEPQQRYSGKVWSQLAEEKKKTNQLSSKAFFNNIKAQLTSIRTDVNKLVGTSRQNMNKPIKTQNGITNSSSKFTGSGYNYLNKSFGSSNNIQSTKSTKPTNINISLNSMGPSCGIKNKNSRQDERMNDEEVQVKKLRSSQNINTRKPVFNEQNNQKDNLIKQLQQKWSSINMQYMQKIEQNKNVLNLLQQQKLGHQKTKQICKSIQQSLQQVQNHKKLIEQQLLASKQQIQQKDKYYTDKLKQQYLESQSIQKSQQQSQNRLMIKNKQIDQLKSKIKSLTTNIEELKKQKQEYSNKDYEIMILRNQIDTFKTQQVTAPIDFKNLGEQYQNKINSLIQQNYSLKNRITHLQNNVEYSSIQIKSLQSTIQAFYERDRDDNYGSKAKAEQLQSLKNKLMDLQSQIDKMQSQHQFQIMKLENQKDQLKQQLVLGWRKQQSKPINQILKDQISQIQNLRSKLRQKNQIIAKFK